MPNSAPSYSTRSKTASDSSASKGSMSCSPVSSSCCFSASASSFSDSAYGSSSPSFFGLSRTWSRSTSISLAKLEEVGDGRQEDGRGLAAPPGPYETADGLREEERRRDGGGVHADREPRHVDALGHHADRDHPAVLVLAELVDPLGGAGVVGEDDGRLGAGDLADQLGVRARRVLVGGDDERRRRPGCPCAPRSAAGRRRAARSASSRRAGRARCARPAQMASLVIGSPSRAAISSPALVRQRMLPL